MFSVGSVQVFRWNNKKQDYTLYKLYFNPKIEIEKSSKKNTCIFKINDCAYLISDNATFDFSNDQTGEGFDLTLKIEEDGTCSLEGANFRTISLQELKE